MGKALCGKGNSSYMDISTKGQELLFAEEAHKIASFYYNFH